MSQIKLVPVEEAPADVRELYDGMLATRGTVANLFLALGHSSKMLGPAMALAAFVGAEGSAIPARHKQLAYLAASRVNHCHYCLARHAVAGAKVGLTPAQVEAILSEGGELADKAGFEEQERLIIRYAEELTRNIKGQPATIAALHEIYDDGAFLELTYVVATANMFNRLADGLEIELEPEFRQA